MAEARALVLELGLFVRPRIELVDLAQLEAQEVLALGAPLLGVVRALELALRSRQRVDRLFERDAARSSLPNASRYSRCVAGSVSETLSCCEAMSQRSGASSGSCARRAEPPVDVRAAPPLALDHPADDELPLSSGCPAASSFAATREPGSTSKSASTSASRSPLRTMSGLARAPRTSDEGVDEHRLSRRPSRR